MYAKPFNPNDMKNTGEIIGDPRFAFQQGQQLYNSAKDPVDAHGRVMQVEPAKPKAPVPQIPVDKDAVEVAPKLSEMTDDDKAKVLEESPASADAEFDLKAWALGEVQSTLTFAALRSKVMELTGDDSVTSTAKARAAILAHYDLTPNG